MSATVLCLTGPTASGKTDAALAVAQRLPVEIVSVDSALVYRGMDIGTAKPDSAIRKAVPHHLIDIRDPDDPYSAAQFCEDAKRVMGEIVARRRVPLLVGGTMLYLKSLLEGLDELPPANAEIRAAIDARANSLGWPALHAELAAIDPRAAARIKPADSQRLQRALEVFQLTGKPMSALLGARNERQSPYRYRVSALVPSDRAVLHQRIEQRFDQMLGHGLVEEVRQLRARFKLAPDMPSMRAVGYRQAWQFIEGEIDLAALREHGIAATRQLAKRQLTWLRSMPHVAVFDSLSRDSVARLGDYCLKAIAK